MNAKRPLLSRRSLLRGASGLGLAVPFLESLAPRSARAAAPPKRIVFVYSSNGTVLNQWKPTEVGPNFSVPSILAPLDTPLLRPKLTVLSGIKMESAIDVAGGNGHAVGMTSMLTGRKFTEVVPTQFGDVGWGAGISIDQALAQRVAAPGQLASLEAGVQTKKQYQNFYAYTSYAEGGGSAGAIPADDDPTSVFTRLFANVPDSEAAKAELERVVAQRKSVLDVVAEDWKTVDGRVSKGDQERLDKHLDLLRSLQDRIQVGEVCEKPTEPTFTSGELGSDQSFPAITAAQMGTLAAALACDVTRVATLQFSGAQSGTVFNSFVDADWDNLADDYHHGLSHLSVGWEETPDATQARAQQALSNINTWFSAQIASFAELLAGYTEPDGSTVLDNTAIVWVSEISEGPTHSFRDMPFVVLGDLGGALRAGSHYAYDNTRAHNDLFVTLGLAMGLDDFTSFGDPAYVMGPLADLLA
jgi:hypothetical protein